MWQKIKDNPSRFHFLAYCISFIGYGALLTGLGPLIPYLAENQHVSQTQYSFFFFARAIGFVVGAFTVKVIEKHISFHNTLILSTLLIFVSFTLFSWETNMTMQGVYVFLGSVFSAVMEIVLNVSLLTAHVGQHQQFYMQVGHGMFGVGGFFSPFVVLFFEQSTYFVISLIMVLVLPAYYFLETPQAKKKVQGDQILQAGNLVDEVKRIQHRISGMSQNTLQRKKTYIIYLICFMFFVYIGAEVAYAGWISSYAVLEGIATKEGATVFSSLFWAFMTLFRFIFAFVLVKPSIKLKFLMFSQLIITVVTIIMIEGFGLKQFAAYFASIAYGVTFSALFGLFFVLPSQYGMQVTCQEGSSFLLYGQLGEGVISMFVGYLMSWFTPTMIYYSILFCVILLLWSCNTIINTLVSEKQRGTIENDMNDYNVSNPHKHDYNNQTPGIQLKEKMLKK